MTLVTQPERAGATEVRLDLLTDLFLCGWCSKTLTASHTKPRQYCNSVCRKNHERHPEHNKESWTKAKLMNRTSRCVRPPKRFVKDPGGVGVCPKGKDLGHITAPPEPTPTITRWERGEVEHKARRKTGFLEVERIGANRINRTTKAEVRA